MATHLSADYVIVGAGLTGCVMASRLSQSEGKPRVVLIEAGPDASGNAAARGFLSALSLLGGELDYAHQSQPVEGTAGRTHTLNAGRVLGGGTMLNFGGWLRADAADYDEWAAVAGDDCWSHEHLLPWLQRVERFEDLGADAERRGFSGPIDVTSASAAESSSSSSSSKRSRYPLRQQVKDAWAELAIVEPSDSSSSSSSITGLLEYNENSSRQGLRQPAHSRYTLRDVTVLTNSVVRKVVLVDKTATAVELVDGRLVTARAEVILCAGTYHTPQLLMLSGIGPSSVLGHHGIPLVHESPRVGENLHDHFALYLAFCLRDPSLGHALGSAAWPSETLTHGLPIDWVVSQPVPADLLVQADNKYHVPPRNLVETLVVYMNPGLQGIPLDGSHIATSTMLLLPTSRGSVSIRSGRVEDPPLIQPNYLSTALDRHALVHGVRQTLRLMLETSAMGAVVQAESPPAPNLAPLTPDATDAEIEQRIRLTGTQHHHSGGTAAMGSVVDAQGRVGGVRRLRVADASIIPVPLGGHPQATLYAMAEQLAAMTAAAKQQVGGGP